MRAKSGIRDQEASCTFVVQFGKKDQAGNRANQAEEHIGLRIPQIPLGTQKGCRIPRAGQRCQPFDNLIECGNPQRKTVPPMFSGLFASAGNLAKRRLA
jgi:hypothetical protein